MRNTSPMVDKTFLDDAWWLQCGMWFQVILLPLRQGQKRVSFLFAFNFSWLVNYGRGIRQKKQADFVETFAFQLVLT